MDDPYDYTGLGFIPNEFNSLRLGEAPGRTRGATELKGSRRGDDGRLPREHGA